MTDTMTIEAPGPDTGDADGADVVEDLPGIWSEWRPPVWLAWVAGALLVLVVAMLVFAGRGAPFAAKVNGETIPQSEFDAWMEVLRDQPEIGNQFLGGAEIEGAAPFTWSTQSAGELLTILIRTRIVADAAVRAGVAPSPAEIDESAAELQAQAQEQGLDVSGLPDWFFEAVTVSQLSTRNLVEAEIVREVGAEEIARLRAQQPAQFQRYDVEIVFGRDVAAVEAFVAGAGAGPWSESVTAEQRQAGLQTQRTTLSLASLRVAVLQDAVRRLQPGQVSGVVVTDEVPAVAFRLVGTEPAPDSEVLSALARERNIDVESFLNAIVASADVTVNPRLGRWSGSGVDPTTGEPASPGVVLPPAAPADNGEVERRDERAPGGFDQLPPGVQVPQPGPPQGPPQGVPQGAPVPQ